MMTNIYLFVTCFFVVTFKCTANPALQVTKCAADDLKCIKQSAQNLLPRFAEGIPDFQMEKLDPLVLNKDLDASSPGLNLVVKNLVITGLNSCTVKKIERDLVKSKMYTRLLCNVRADGQYEMHGRLLVLPIEGKGDSSVVLRKMQIDVENDMNDRTGRDGKKHWHIKSSRFTYDLKDKATVKFENLFNGNEVLARAANEVIANSPNEIVMEVGRPIIKTIVDKIVANVNRFYKAMPANEISLD